MLPRIWIFDTYSLMIGLGVIVCLLLFMKYNKKLKTNRDYVYLIEILGVLSVMVGLLSATLFQYVFDSLNKEATNTFGAMTFYGGLIGGAIFFIIGYFAYVKKKYPGESFIKNVLIVAPSCITIAHAFGRIGCFCAGCCYGKETNSFLGVKFPDLLNKVYPTQLFESIFLFILTAVLFFLAYKYYFLYTMPLYMVSYGVFRFLIEFIRGDERGAFLLNMSPAQWISILLVIGSIILFIFLKKYKEKNEDALKFN